MTKTTGILVIILALATLLRLSGVGYGLPLWLISDEPPFTAATLKMIELKTVLPVLNEEAFKKVIYFPPYLSYLYLFPMSAILGMQYLFFDGTLTEFKNYVAADPSTLFFFVRFLNVVLGVAAVYLVYRVTKNIFNRELPSLSAAFFLATSILHIDLSFVGRDWGPAIFLFTLMLFFLTSKTLPLPKRYIYGAIIAGFAFGISLIAAFGMVFMLLWYLFAEHHSVVDAFKERSLYVALIVFLMLAGLSIAVFPFGFVFAKYTSAGNPKTLGEFLYTLYYFFIPIFRSEPTLIAMSAIGFIYTYRRMRGYFLVVLSFILAYATIFYFTYHYHPRFTAYLFPILATLAGYATSTIYNEWYGALKYAALVPAFTLPLAAAFAFGALTWKDDSRIEARSFVETNVPAETKIITEARLFRLSSTKDAITEQERIDAASLRHIDRAEAAFSENPHGYRSFHALNLYTINSDEFWENLPKYAQEHGYEYLLYDPLFEGEKQERVEKLRELAARGVLIRSFGSNKKGYSLESAEFGNVFGLFTLPRFGPRMELYRLR